MAYYKMENLNYKMDNKIVEDLKHLPSSNVVIMVNRCR